MKPKFDELVVGDLITVESASPYRDVDGEGVHRKVVKAMISKVGEFTHEYSGIEVLSESGCPSFCTENDPSNGGFSNEGWVLEKFGWLARKVEGYRGVDVYRTEVRDRYVYFCGECGYRAGAGHLTGVRVHIGKKHG